VAATASRFHITHRALEEMRLMTAVALKRGRNYMPSHGSPLLKPRPQVGLTHLPLGRGADRRCLACLRRARFVRCSVLLEIGSGLLGIQRENHLASIRLPLHRLTHSYVDQRKAPRSELTTKPPSGHSRLQLLAC
jgi:hypothetical protein